MSKILLTSAQKLTDGIAITLKAETRERRIKALEATLRATRSFEYFVQDELALLKSIQPAD
jgi:hypothetical protein